MSIFDDDRYCWRETYLVMLDRSQRPTASETARCLQKQGVCLEITNLRSDADGWLESLTVISPNDNAAVEIQYFEGDEIAAEFAALADELERHELSAKERKKIDRSRNFFAKIELRHFEQLHDVPTAKAGFPPKLNFPRHSSFVKNLAREMPVDEPDEFDMAERLDPDTLIRILKLVSHLTDGIAFDPASGVVL